MTSQEYCVVLVVVGNALFQTNILYFTFECPIVYLRR
jgi:hypothetical protein